MPSKKGRTDPRWLVILEDIRSQNRSTIEAVEASRGAFERSFEQSDRENRLRFAALEAALQRIDQESRSRDSSLALAIRGVKLGVQQNSVDIRDLASKVEALSRLEERVSALERRGA